MKKAFVFLADGFEEIEALSPVDYLRRAGVDVVTLAVGKTDKVVHGAHKISVFADEVFSDVLKNLSDLPDAVVIPGGMPGATNLASSSELRELINRMCGEKRLVAAICASPAVVLAETAALEGRAWTCYPGMEDFSEKSKSFGGNHQKGSRVVCDGSLITACGPGAAEEFSMAIVEYLTDSSVREKVHGASCQR